MSWDALRTVLNDAITLSDVCDNAIYFGDHGSASIPIIIERATGGDLGMTVSSVVAEVRQSDIDDRPMGKLIEHDGKIYRIRQVEELPDLWWQLQLERADL